MAPTEWITVGIAVLALGLSVYNTLVQRSDRRPRVRIRSEIVIEEVDRHSAFEDYTCKVTNVGLVGVLIDGVELHPVNGDRHGGVPLGLAKDQPRGKLDPGEAQVWGIWVDRIWENERWGEDAWETIRSTGAVELLAVARDTAGREYEQLEEDSISIKLPGNRARDDEDQ